MFAGILNPCLYIPPIKLLIGSSQDIDLSDQCAEWSVCIVYLWITNKNGGSQKLQKSLASSQS